jgi:glucosamine kinase
VDLVIGVDAGGTTTRCLVANTQGHPVGFGTAAGLNQHSSGGDPVDRLARAVAGALSGHDPAAVRAGTLGVAGAGAAGLAEVDRQATDVWRRLGLNGDPVVVPDLLAAFAAGTPSPSGIVLVAGTGAGAAAVVDRRVVRQADAAGWRRGARDLDGRGPATAFTRPLLERLLGHPPPYDVQDVIAQAYAVPPASLGMLAPVVTDHSGHDPVADEILGRGRAGLLASLDAVRLDAPGPVVLAGALLTSSGPVRDGVAAGIAERGLGDPGVAHLPAAGAAWLALASRGVTDEAVHARLNPPKAATPPG